MADSMFSVQDKVAIVTGADRGYGKGMALGFTRAGAKVVIAEIDDTVGEATAKEIRGLGGDALFVYTDVTKSDLVENMVAKTIEKYGRLDILVNNVGNNKGLRELVVNMKEEDWDYLVDLNLKSFFLGCRAAARVMMKQKEGNIINISTTGALRPGPGNTPYTAAKAGVIQFTQSVAVELAAYNIRVNCIVAGSMEPPVAAESQGDPKKKAAAIPLGRLGRPDDMAGTAIYLASDASSYVTGETFIVRGGPTARPGDLELALKPKKA